MKLVFNKTSQYMAHDLANHLRVLFKQHGIKVKESLIMQFEYKAYLSLGGKKEKYKSK